MSNTTFDTQALSLIEEHVRRLLANMGFEEASVRGRVTGAQADLTKETPERTNLLILIEAGDEGRMLIGTQGAHLIALQHMIRCVLRRHLSEHVYVSVDVNGYRARRDRGLLDLAEASARRAKMQGRTVVLNPMGASDRRAIHTALASRSDVKTESLGDEPNRRVVIKPVFL